jgi:hypothetical protein
LCLAAASLVAAATGTPPSSKPSQAEQSLQYARGKQLATLADSSIVESSGLAASRRVDGVFWTHNDSGRPSLHALDRSGRKLGTFLVRGAVNRDWEDIASFRRGDRCLLLIGDVGDNRARRATCTLYLVEEPRLPAAKAPAASQPAAVEVPCLMKIDFRYADGPRDCEAIAVDPTDRTVYLVTKTLLFGAKVYQLALPDELGKKPGTEPLVAQPVAWAAISLATGMDISPDGRRAIVCNYGEAFEFVRHPDEAWAKAFGRLPRRVAVPARKQGEAICYGSDGRTLYLTSEGLPTPLLEVPAESAE